MTSRQVSRWPQVTLREILLLMTFFAVIYGLSVLRDDRESLITDVVRTPILLVVFVLWRVTQHCRRINNWIAQLIVDSILGSALGAMGGVTFCVFFLSGDFYKLAIALAIGLCVGLIAAITLGTVLGRYRTQPQDAITH